jgi:hypothetical protein
MVGRGVLTIGAQAPTCSLVEVNPYLPMIAGMQLLAATWGPKLHLLAGTAGAVCQSRSTIRNLFPSGSRKVNIGGT